MERGRVEFIKMVKKETEKGEGEKVRERKSD